jgi:phosphatidylglycerol---prolipoprotein diacylglyceryl transferase
MFPILFTVGPLTISSFGVFLSASFLFGAFLIWRLARGWELDEEKVLDLILLSFFGGILGARIWFVLFNLSFFANDLYKAVLITKYPGLSFWGGFLGGLLTLLFFSRRLSLSFSQAADLGAIGLLGGIILGDIGCLLSGCDVGIASSSAIAVNIVGVIDKRFPVQAVEALLILFVLWRLWKHASRFHFHGKIFSLTMVWLGVIKFLTQFYRDSSTNLANLWWVSFILSGVVFAFGFFTYYKTGKGDFREDLVHFIKNSTGIFTSSRARRSAIESTKKNWYNQKVIWNTRLKRLSKLPRKLRVKPTPKNI